MVVKVVIFYKKSLPLQPCFTHTDIYETQKNNTITYTSVIHAICK